MKLDFRGLKANEIECRIARITPQKGLMLLLYKDARVDQRLLDEQVGAMNWQRSHEIIGGNLYCTVSIWDEERQMWVSKQDVGVESYAEKEKGQASDSFKRACFNWGIGRELYSTPFIWVEAKDCNIQTANGKNACYDEFYVEDIHYDDNKNIDALSIKNRKTKKRVFLWDNRKEKVKENEEQGQA
jgi:hypothetical protein